ncbi:MAG: phosphopantetheine-binding protein [Myxococcota bacterium]
MEKKVAEIWQKVLGTQRVGLRDNFFNLGGHSLLCMQAIGQIEKVTGKRLSPRVILLNTLEQVAAQLP